MKKIFIVFLLIIVVFFYQLIIPYNKIIIENIIFSFIPSLLPCLIIVNFIIEIDALTFLYHKLNHFKLGRILYIIIVIIICSCLGMPSLQFVIFDLYKKNIIEEESLNNFIYSFGTISFPFLYGVCIYNISNKSIAILMLIIFYIVNATCLLLKGFKVNQVNIKLNNCNYMVSLNKAFISSAKTIITIVGTVIFFSLFLFLLEKIPLPWKWLFEGLIEFSYPMINASKANNFIGYIMIIFISLYPSLSMIIQSKSINKELKIKKYISTRIIVSTSALIILIFILKLFNYNIWH